MAAAGEAMTYEDLLEEINYEIKDIAFHKIKTVYPYLAALRNVLELHKPTPARKKDKLNCLECMSMDYDHYWDNCETIQLIKKELSNG